MSFLSSSQKALVNRLAGLVEDVEARMMLGTVGVFSNNQQFGILEDEELYLCVDDDTRSDFAEAGTAPYNAAAVDAAAYLKVPDRVMDDDTMLAAWVHRSIEAAE